MCKETFGAPGPSAGTPPKLNVDEEGEEERGKDTENGRRRRG